jgi:hypothetical protein
MLLDPNDVSFPQAQRTHGSFIDIPQNSFINLVPLERVRVSRAIIHIAASAQEELEPIDP